MPIRDTAHTFGAISVLNHWLLATPVIALLASGLVAAELLGEDARAALLAPHKAVGLSVLVVVAWSALWRRLQVARPGVIPGTPAAEAFARKAMPAALVLGTALLSAFGIVMAVFKGKAVEVFALFTIPARAEVPWLAAVAHDVHVIGGWLLVAAVLGHAAVALRHHLVDHDATFVRMMGRGA